MRALLDDPALRPRGDLLLARQALAEGDATLVMMLFGFKRAGLAPRPEAFPSGDALRTLLENVGPGGFPELRDAPPFVREQLLEPYWLGLDLVLDAWRKGGWAAVDALWHAPPSSTEQLLHADRRHDPPMVVTVEPPEDWHTITSMELGELGVRAWLASRLGEAAAVAAAEGWGGDRVALIEQPRRPRPGERRGKYPAMDTALCVNTAWDTRPDADRFALAAERWLRLSTSDDDDWRIEQHANDVGIFLHRAIVPEEIVDPIGRDPWDRPASTLQEHR